jgi:SAM-dependent methyltransferase
MHSNAGRQVVRTHPLPDATSADETVTRFDTAAAAAKYSTALNDSPTHRRELRCILAALTGVPAGASVLDLPCGTGRLLPALTERGFDVTSADSSPHMVEQAKAYAGRQGLSVEPRRFLVANVMSLPFEDGRFDAVVCNRLFHHFREPQVRRDALVELRRVSRGPVVASFFCNSSLDAVMFHLMHALRRKKPTDRIPIPRRRFAADAAAAGLTVRQWLPIRAGISRQWYAVMERA